MSKRFASFSLLGMTSSLSGAFPYPLRPFTYHLRTGVVYSVDTPRVRGNFHGRFFLECCLGKRALISCCREIFSLWWTIQVDALYRYLETRGIYFRRIHKEKKIPATSFGIRITPTPTNTRGKRIIPRPRSQNEPNTGTYDLVCFN